MMEGKGWQHGERGKDDGVRRCSEFDSSSCQRRCIIDVLRIPHCRRDSLCVTSRPVWLRAHGVLWLHLSRMTATCHHLHITGSYGSDNAVSVALTTWEGQIHVCTHTLCLTSLWEEVIVCVTGCVIVIVSHVADTVSLLTA